MKTISRIPSLILSALLCSSCAHRAGWTKVMMFDVHTEAVDKADLPDGNLITAEPCDTGWTIAVYQPPVTGDSQNLLYRGRNLHGVQPWYALPWTQHGRIYPDTRIVSYGSPEKTIRIELIDCVTTQKQDKIEFVKGSIAVHWKQ